MVSDGLTFVLVTIPVSLISNGTIVILLLVKKLSLLLESHQESEANILKLSN